MSSPKNPAKSPVQLPHVHGAPSDGSATPVAGAPPERLHVDALRVEVAETEEEAQNRRRHNRRTVVWKATIQVGAHKLPCWVRNISPFGALLQIDLPLAQGSAAVIDLDKIGPVAGCVAWSNGTLHGIAFMESPEIVAKRFGPEAERLGFFRTANQVISTVRPLTPAADTSDPA